MIQELLIPARYCGPPRSGNGGYTAGLLAHAIEDSTDGDPVTVTVRLQKPPPLDIVMQIATDTDGLTLLHEGHVVATARVDDRDLEVVEPVAFADAVNASASFAGHDEHPLPGCFSCGTDSADGLRIFPGIVSSVDGRPRVAAPWTPDDSVRADFHELHDPEARTCLAATWSALDCVGGWAGNFGPDKVMLLGSMTARVESLPTSGEPHVVVGQLLSTEGRKTRTAATLYDSDARVVGMAEHLWISIDPTLIEGIA